MNGGRQVLVNGCEVHPSVCDVREEAVSLRRKGHEAVRSIEIGLLLGTC